ncbi:MAG: rhodanese-like domain-containing protein [Planctomycetota bacterium]
MRDTYHTHDIYHTMTAISRRSLTLFALLLALPVLSACDSTQTNTSDASINRLLPGQAAALIEGGALPVDLRSAEAFAEGHLPNAINARLALIGNPDNPVLPRDRPVLVYDADGRGTAAAAAKKLIKAGHPAVHELQGGYRAWLNPNPTAPPDVLDATP